MNLQWICLIHTSKMIQGSSIQTYLPKSNLILQHSPPNTQIYMLYTQGYLRQRYLDFFFTFLSCKIKNFTMHTFSQTVDKETGFSLNKNNHSGSVFIIFIKTQVHIKKLPCDISIYCTYTSSL
jgi:hypothetical protein